MKILITESQYKYILEQDDWWKHSSYEKGILDRSSAMLDKMSKLDHHDLMTTLQIGTAFIPYVGPFISTGVGLLDAKMYYDEGDKTSAGVVAFFSILPGIGAVISKIPGVKQLGQKGMNALAKKIISKETQTLTQTEIEVVKGITSNSDEVLNLAKTESNKIKGKFNLQRDPSTKPPKKPWVYEKIKISDNLEMIKNPKGGSVREIRNLTTGETVYLKKSSDELGEFYYLSAQMKNPVEAGRTFQALIKEIPKGSRFGEPLHRSLSTDSFYAMLRRIKDFKPKVVGYIKLNGAGVHRFQEYIRRFNIKSGSELVFKNQFEAKPLLNRLNSELKKYNLPDAKIFQDADGWGIQVPNIQYIIQ